MKYNYLFKARWYGGGDFTVYGPFIQKSCHNEHYSPLIYAKKNVFQDKLPKWTNPYICGDKAQ